MEFVGHVMTRFFTNHKHSMQLSMKRCIFLHLFIDNIFQMKKYKAGIFTTAASAHNYTN